jgi:hypothetical protein
MSRSIIVYVVHRRVLAVGGRDSTILLRSVCGYASDARSLVRGSYCV